MNDAQSGSPSGSLLDRISEWLGNAPETRNQLIMLLRRAQQRDLLDAEALSMMEGVLQVAELTAHDSMIPRAQMDVIDISQDDAAVLEMVIRTAHSRFPVVEGDRDNVIGILHAKDLLRQRSGATRVGYAAAATSGSDLGGHSNGSSQASAGTHQASAAIRQVNAGTDQASAGIHQAAGSGGNGHDLRSLLRPAVFIPESKRLNVLLHDFRANRHHIAIVVDEYGGVAGLITIEDILEQIVGDIEDEFDFDVESDHITEIEAGEHGQRYRIRAITEIRDVNERLGTAFETDEFDTIGGLLTDHFGRVPGRGDAVIIDGLRFEVLRADERSLQLLLVERAPAAVSANDNSQ